MSSLPGLSTYHYKSFELIFVWISASMNSIDFVPISNRLAPTFQGKKDANIDIIDNCLEGRLLITTRSMLQCDCILRCIIGHFHLRKEK